MIESPHVASDSWNCLCLLMGKFGCLERGEKRGAFQSFNMATMWGIQVRRIVALRQHPVFTSCIQSACFGRLTSQWVGGVSLRFIGYCTTASAQLITAICMAMRQRSRVVELRVRSAALD